MPTREELDQLIFEVDTDPQLSAEEKEILFSDIEAELDKLDQAPAPTGPQPPGFLQQVLSGAQKGVSAVTDPAQFARKPLEQAIAGAIVA
jgi:hypothetical protein